MAKAKQGKKRTAKVQDMAPKSDVKGGGKKKKGQQEYLVIKMNDVIITS